MIRTVAEELLDGATEIEQRWHDRWSSAGRGRGQAEEALKDHIGIQLRAIAGALRDPDRPDPAALWEQRSLLDPEARVLQVPIEEVVQQYGVLVDVLRDWIEERQIEASFADFSYIYRAMFELVAESVRRYAQFETERVARDRSAYLAELLHQIRTPLSVLGSGVSLLQRSPEHRIDAEFLARMERNHRRLSLLVTSVMRLERFKPEEIPVRAKRVHVARLMDEILTDHDHEAAAKGLRLELDVDRTLDLEVDPELLVDVLDNLVGNAVKFTAEGRVRVSVAEDEEANEILFRVQDTGPGIPPDRQSELFQWVRPNNTSGSTGIGLAVAHRAALALGGTLSVESEPGRGARFTLRLPCRRGFERRSE